MATVEARPAPPKKRRGRWCRPKARCGAAVGVCRLKTLPLQVRRSNAACRSFAADHVHAQRRRRRRRQLHAQARSAPAQPPRARPSAAPPAAAAERARRRRWPIRPRSCRWRRPRGMVQAAAPAREAGEFIDITLLVGERKIPAHKLVLVSLSPYLDGLLTSGLAESKQGGDDAQGRRRRARTAARSRPSWTASTPGSSRSRAAR